MPPVTVISNFNVTIAANAIPVFADVDPETFNICPKDIERGTPLNFDLIT